jgi:Fe-S oxidoreductase
MELNFSIISMVLFTILVLAGLATFGYVMYRRFMLMTKGPGENRFDQIPQRIMAALKFGFLQGRMPREKQAGYFHIFIFAGFMVLSVRSTIIFGMAYGGSDFGLGMIPVVGSFFNVLYGLLKDLVVIGVLIGCVGFAYRRLISKPPRMQNVPQLEPVVILCWIAGLMFADMLLEGGYIAWANANNAHVPPIALGMLLAPLFTPESGETMFKAMVWIHSFMILAFLNYLPFGKHFHVITGIPNVFFMNLKAKGRVTPIEDLEGKFERMEEEPDLPIGIAQFEHLHWKQVMDIYSCTECGRCVPQCPAFSTDKPLSLRDMNKSIKKHMYAKEPHLIGPLVPAKNDAELKEWGEELLATGAVTAETIWSCTLCGDCEERCPVLIEQVPRIVQMRQYMAMITGEIPTEIANFFKGVERNSNPWGLAPDKRADWITKGGEDFAVKQFSELTPEELEEIEYCYFVGCMGSFDDQAQKTTISLCKILNAAGVKYAVLGVEEQCNGETARRLGNEYLGQMLTVMNIQTFMNYGVKKIISNCPHCFNTLANEYPDFMDQARSTHDDKAVAANYEGVKNFEVVNATELVRKLIAEGKVKLKKNNDLGDVAYHDPCFLGRYNNIFEPQREMIELAGGKVLEPELTGVGSFCCGAGGGRMWVEEHQPRVNTERFKQLYADCNEPKTIGVSCPFCMTMLVDGSKDEGKDEQVKIMDVMQIVADNLES